MVWRPRLTAPHPRARLAARTKLKEYLTTKNLDAGTTAYIGEAVRRVSIDPCTTPS